MSVTALSNDIPHLMPVACSACTTGKARLVECRPHELDGEQIEIWVFKCDDCGAVSAVPVDR